eukprot:9906089-Prorocentrum_lima.AAC.1
MQARPDEPVGGPCKATGQQCVKCGPDLDADADPVLKMGEALGHGCWTVSLRGGGGGGGVRACHARAR